MMSISKKNGKNFIFLLIIFSIISISGFTITKLYKQNLQLRKLIPYIIPGEKLESVELENILTRQQLGTMTDDISMYFIFESPCSSCNKNILYWNRLSSVFKNRANHYGIIIDKDPESKEKMKNIALEFEIYSPQDIELFKEMFKVRHKTAQTIISVNGKVKYIKIGNLNIEEYKKIVKLIKNIRGSNE